VPEGVSVAKRLPFPVGKNIFLVGKDIFPVGKGIFLVGKDIFPVGNGHSRVSPIIQSMEASA
jgi:hypothetical protein